MEMYQRNELLGRRAEQRFKQMKEDHGNYFCKSSLPGDTQAWLFASLKYVYLSWGCLLLKPYRHGRSEAVLLPWHFEDPHQPELNISTKAIVGNWRRLYILQEVFCGWMLDNSGWLCGQILPPQ